MFREQVESSLISGPESRIQARDDQNPWTIWFLKVATNLQRDFKPMSFYDLVHLLCLYLIQMVRLPEYSSVMAQAMEFFLGQQKHQRNPELRCAPPKKLLGSAGML